MYSKIILSLLYFVAFSNASRVIYMIMHAEKPGFGDLRKGQRWSTTQNIPGEYDNGLSYTGYERSKCLVNVFGRNAPLYRQPKAILYQHYAKQGDFIDSGERGSHQSRRMYETASLLAQDLGINLDEQKCCGGDPSDMFKYIETLDESINPILIVHQHQQIYAIAKKYAKKFGKTLPYSEFSYNSSTIWTLVEGEVVEDWNMGCYFDKPTKQDKLSDSVEQLVLGNSNLNQVNGNNSTLVQEVTPLITTKVVPASLLTTVTSKVPPTGPATIGLVNQPMDAGAITSEVLKNGGMVATATTSKALEGSKTIPIMIVTGTPTAEGKTTKTVPDIVNNGEDANTPADKTLPDKTLPDKTLPGKTLPGKSLPNTDPNTEEVAGAEPAEKQTNTETGGIPAIVIPEVHAPVNIPGGGNNNNNNNKNNNKNNNNNNNNNNNPWGGNNNPWGGNNKNDDKDKNKNNDPWAEVFGNNNDPWAEIFGNNKNNDKNNNNNGWTWVFGGDNQKNKPNNNWNWWNPWSNNNNNNNNNNNGPNWFQNIVNFFRF